MAPPPRLWSCPDGPPADDPAARPLLAGSPAAALAGRSGLCLAFESPAAQRQFGRRRIPGLGWAEQRDGAGVLRALRATAPGAALALACPAELKAVARHLGARELLVLAPRADAVQALDAWAEGRVAALAALEDWARELPGAPLGTVPLLVKDGVFIGVYEDGHLLRADGSRAPFGPIAPDAAAGAAERAGARLAAQLLLFGLGLVAVLLALMALW